jgi:hypothetical protein
MKTNLFNFRRVGLLFQRYFFERFRTELIYWGIMAIVFMFFRNNFTAMMALVTVAGVFYAARFFKEIHHSANGIFYFMTPATQLEKLTVAIVMTTLYYFSMMMVVYVIGNLTGTFLSNMLADTNFFPNAMFHHSSLQWKLFEEGGLLPLVTFASNSSDIENIRITGSLFTVFLVNQSLFLFGSIYFKRNQAFKTFSGIILICILLSILISIEARLILGDAYFSGVDMVNVQKEELAISFRKFAHAVKIFYTLLPLYFWVVSYFRLTEKQV